MFARPQSKKLGRFSLFDVRMVCTALNTKCASIKFLKSLPQPTSHLTQSHTNTHTHAQSAHVSRHTKYIQIKIPRD